MTVMTPYQLREATLADLPALVQMMRQSALESEGKDIPLETAQAALQNYLTHPEWGTYFVFVDPHHGATPSEHPLLGSLFVTPEFSDWHNGLYWWLQSVYILPEYRGQGLLDMFLTALDGEAQKQGILEIRLYVHQDNARAIRAYEKTHFTPQPYRVMTRPVGGRD